MLKLNSSNVFVLISNFFNYCSFSLYLFSALQLSPLFFHTEDESLSKILGVITIFLSIIFKPVGALIFGHIGDKYGRRRSLLLCLVGMTFATGCIGILPTYSSIGILSGALLIMYVAIQGICIGGQYTGALIFVQEHIHKKHSGLACALVGSFGVLGTLVGTGSTLLFGHIYIEEWAWRLPFLTSLIIGLSLLSFTKRYILETPEFISQKKKSQSIGKYPVRDIIANYKTVVFSAICISSIPVSMFYAATVYVPNFIANEKQSFSPLFYTAFAQGLSLILIPFFGYISDRVGKKAQMGFTSVLLSLSPLLIICFMSTFRDFLPYIYIIFLILILGLYAGPAPAFLSENFPVIGRYSGLGFGISLGEGIFGGLTPLTLVLMQAQFHTHIAPSFVFSFLGLLSLLGLLALLKRKHLEPTPPKPT